MNKLDQILEEIKEKRPALYGLIADIIDDKIPKEELQQFLTLSPEDKKQWIIDHIERLEVRA
ncbi:hypothetical protein F6P74_09205 [Streptococcus suis]|uniref:hypothetical protein n=1 Tax=Streptococcus suis TaxID=1307 RepID=UPI000CF44F71|nr:hypothetical protein [Streptococcus suis]MBS8071691.1 hypothetical protein [Streptococcus suis]MBS8095146.1 hypothetical protein [Streptococcus suis]MBS8104016.1 hypothetical protein [Streptococcus suis]MBY4978336.1 hypothetical protein [Streptococcus suis]MCO8179781.1 hypothetical protein [Streptococcus suis]